MTHSQLHPLTHKIICDVTTAGMARVTVTQWNVGCVNLNPFGVRVGWPGLDGLLERATEALRSPAAPRIGDVAFSSDMLAELTDHCRSLELPVTDKAVADMEAALQEPLGWVLSRELTDKRLISLPDRHTSQVAPGLYRPAMTTPATADQLPTNRWAWWKHWLEFMFEDRGAAVPAPAQLVPVTPEKYGAMRERATSQYRQLACLAIFDAVMRFVIMRADPEWSAVRLELLNRFVHGLDDRIAEQLKRLDAGGTDVFCLEEVSPQLARQLGTEVALPGFHVVFPAAGKQLPVVALRKAVFPAIEHLRHDVRLLTIKATTQEGFRVLLGAFHADSSGKDTVATIEEVIGRHEECGADFCAIGADCNTTVLPGVRKLKLDRLVNLLQEEGKEWRLAPPADDLSRGWTACDSKTVLQPQGGKAAKAVRLDQRDFVITNAKMVECHVVRGGGDDDPEVLPTTKWPSDHAAVTAVLSFRS